MKSRPNVRLKSDESPLPGGAAKRAVGGLFDRRERWGLSRRGWFFVLVGFTALFVGLILTIHPFLAMTKRAPSDYLVAEGWVPEYAVQQYAEVFRTGGYKKILTVGGPVSGAPKEVPDDDTHAYVAAMRLKKIGIDPANIEIVPSKVRDRDRTYNCALALKKWFADKGLSPKAIDVATLGVHARRTRLLYQMAFGDDVEIGVIAVQNEEYKPERWWKYSEGVKEIMSEGGAYLYVRLFFRP